MAKYSNHRMIVIQRDASFSQMTTKRIKIQKGIARYVHKIELEQVVHDLFMAIYMNEKLSKQTEQDIKERHCKAR